MFATAAHRRNFNSQTQTPRLELGWADKTFWKSKHCQGIPNALPFDKVMLDDTICSHQPHVSIDLGLVLIQPFVELQVVFDPLDGSSILSANLAVGTIFGIWDTPSLLGHSCRRQVAAGYAVYGPRTLLVWAVPRSEGGSIFLWSLLLLCLVARGLKIPTGF